MTGGKKPNGRNVSPPRAVCTQMKAQMDEAIKSDRMKPSEAMRLLDDYERGLKEYTYLNF